MTTTKNINIRITITWSKIMSAIILGLSVFFDLYYSTTGQIFMWAVPICGGLIVGKQGLDAWKDTSKSKTTTQ